ncbi:MAG: hypothetical protein KA715_14005 [Xanthomonadaceae bacterium]|nr:hypothetical protein [Xanthomonadaceae bacterium]
MRSLRLNWVIAFFIMTTGFWTGLAHSTPPTSSGTTTGSSGGGGGYNCTTSYYANGSECVCGPSGGAVYKTTSYVSTTDDSHAKSCDGSTSDACNPGCPGTFFVCESVACTAIPGTSPPPPPPATTVATTVATTISPPPPPPATTVATTIAPPPPPPSTTAPATTVATTIGVPPPSTSVSPPPPTPPTPYGPLPGYNSQPARCTPPNAGNFTVADSSGRCPENTQRFRDYCTPGGGYICIKSVGSGISNETQRARPIQAQ